MFIQVFDAGCRASNVFCLNGMLIHSRLETPVSNFRRVLYHIISGYHIEFYTDVSMVTMSANGNVGCGVQVRNGVSSKIVHEEEMRTYGSHHSSPSCPPEVIRRQTRMSNVTNTARQMTTRLNIYKPTLYSIRWRRMQHSTQYRHFPLDVCLLAATSIDNVPSWRHILIGGTRRTRWPGC